MNKETNGSGIGFTGLLTIAFIILKLCKVINWSWWWVLSPILFAITFILLCIIFEILFGDDD